MARQSWGYKAVGVRRSFSEDDLSVSPGCTYTRETWPPRGRGRGESLTSSRRIFALMRAGDVVRLRFAGYTWQQIAIAKGFKDASGAWRAARRSIDRIDLDNARKQALKRG